MTTQKGIYIEFPDGSYNVTSRNNKGHAFKMDASALYLTWQKSDSRVFINYAGAQAAESYSKLEVPLDAVYLKEMAKMIRSLARKLENDEL